MQQVDWQLMCLRHVSNEISHPWIGRANYEANRAILAAANPLCKRQDQLLQGRWSVGDAIQIYYKDVRTIGLVKQIGQPIACAYCNLTISE